MENEDIIKKLEEQGLIAGKKGGFCEEISQTINIDRKYFNEARKLLNSDKLIKTAFNKKDSYKIRTALDRFGYAIITYPLHQVTEEERKNRQQYFINIVRKDYDK